MKRETSGDSDIRRNAETLLALQRDSYAMDENGLNRHFLRELLELQAHVQPIYAGHCPTSASKGPYVYGEAARDRLVPCINTGTMYLHLHEDITVVPPICADRNAHVCVVENVRVFPLQTVGRSKYSEQLTSLLKFIKGGIRVKSMSKKLKDHARVTKRLKCYAEKELNTNYLWQSICQTVADHRKGETFHTSMAIEALLSMARDFWFPNEGNVADPDDAVTELLNYIKNTTLVVDADQFFEMLERESDNDAKDPRTADESVVFKLLNFYHNRDERVTKVLEQIPHKDLLCMATVRSATGDPVGLGQTMHIQFTF